MQNSLDANLQLRKIAGGGIRFVNHTVPASEEEINVFPAARAVGETAAAHAEQVALGCVGKFCELSRVENHHTAITKNEKNAKDLQNIWQQHNNSGTI